MAETLGVSVAATPEDGCVASIMRNMSWGASEAQPLSAAGQMPMPQMPMAMPTEDFGGNKDLMQELHMRAAREAALAVGMSPSAAMAAMPMLPTMEPNIEALEKLVAEGAVDGAGLDEGSRLEASYLEYYMRTHARGRI